jgi:hypothetical protein
VRLSVPQPVDALLLTALAMAHAACRHDAASASPLPGVPASRWALPTATMRWNEYACDLITKNASGQQGSVRVLAYVNLTINQRAVHGAPAEHRA